jgi:hypothetical protein
VCIRLEILEAKASGPDFVYVIMHIINKQQRCMYTNHEERVMGD